MAERDDQNTGRKRDALIAVVSLAFARNPHANQETLAGVSDDLDALIDTMQQEIGDAWGLPSLRDDGLAGRVRAAILNYLDAHRDLAGDKAKQYAELVVRAELRSAEMELLQLAARASDTGRVRRITHPEATASGPCPICMDLEGEHDASDPDAWYWHPNCACEIVPVSGESGAGAGNFGRERSMTAGHGLATFKDYDTETRREMARKGEALPDGSFPIANRADLEDALHRIGTTKHARSTVVAHIRKRAKALGAMDALEGGKLDPDAADEAKNSLPGWPAELRPVGFAADGGGVWEGKIFEIGSYDDKDFSLTEDEADERMADFLGCPLDLGHPDAASPADGRLGFLAAMRRDGRDLLGRVELPAAMRQLLGDGPFKPSMAWDRASKLPMKISLVDDPRVTDASLTAAFAATASPPPAARSRGAVPLMVHHPDAVHANTLDHMHDHPDGTTHSHPHPHPDGSTDHEGRGHGHGPALPARPAMYAAKGHRMGLAEFWNKVRGVAAEEGIDVSDVAEFSAQPADPRVDALQQALAAERAHRITSEAAQFADAEITGLRAMPSEREDLIAAYAEAAAIDAAGVATFAAGGQSHVQALRERSARRPQHVLTKRLLDSHLSVDADGRVLDGEGQPIAAFANLLTTPAVGKPKPPSREETDRYREMVRRAP